MGKDMDFKNNVKTEGFNDITEEIELGKLYNPDKVFERGETVVVFESSSTGDRKVHIGEMIQFLSNIVPNSRWKECYFVLFLCGKPDQYNEINRLQNIYDSYPPSKNNRNKIAGIYVQRQPSDDELKELAIEKIKGFGRLTL